jgi:predicted transcriptional regulator
MSDTENEKHPEKMGSAWTEEDDAKLFNLISKNKSIDYIADKLKRTKGGIDGRLRRYCRTEYKAGKTVDELYSLIKIKSKETITKWTEYVENTDKINTEKDILINKIVLIQKFIIQLAEKYESLDKKITQVDNKLDKLTKSFNEIEIDDIKYYLIGNEVYKIKNNGKLGKYIGIFKKGNIINDNEE